MTSCAARRDVARSGSASSRQRQEVQTEANKDQGFPSLEFGALVLHTNM